MASAEVVQDCRIVQPKVKLGLPAVVLINPKYPHNVGGILRACSCFGVRSLIWTGERVRCDANVGERLPREERMKGYRDVTFQVENKPLDLFPKAVPVCVEVLKDSECLTTFEHPEDAVYIFGPEDGGVPQVFRQHCHRFVSVPSHHCLNLAAAVNVVLYDRRMKRQLGGLEPVLPISEMLHEERGHVPTPVMDAMGWDGK